MIHAEGLTREFRVGKETVQAVRGLDLEVREGELVAFLGPNGAGKSTSLRMLTTLLAPTSGSARVAGHDIVTDAAGVRREIGYVGQGHGAADDQLVRDEIVVQGRAYGASARDARARADELIQSLELGGIAERRAGTLSGGQRRRLDIAIGMVHAPRLLFLDEPSTGLDPQSRANLWAHLERVRGESGTTVFLTTHYLEEADAMAERVLVIDAGQVVADGTPDELKADIGGDLVTLAVGPGQSDAAAAIAARVVHGAAIEHGDATVRIRAANGAAEVPRLVLALHEAGVGVLAADVRRPTLDDVFLALTGRRLRDDGDLAPTAAPDPVANGTANAASPMQSTEVAS